MIGRARYRSRDPPERHTHKQPPATASEVDAWLAVTPRFRAEAPGKDATHAGVGLSAILGHGADPVVGSALRSPSVGENRSLVRDNLEVPASHHAFARRMRR